MILSFRTADILDMFEPTVEFYINYKINGRDVSAFRFTINGDQNSSISDRSFAASKELQYLTKQFEEKLKSSPVLNIIKIGSHPYFELKVKNDGIKVTDVMRHMEDLIASIRGVTSVTPSVDKGYGYEIMGGLRLS